MFQIQGQVKKRTGGTFEAHRPFQIRIPVLQLEFSHGGGQGSALLVFANTYHIDPCQKQAAGQMAAHKAQGSGD